MPKEPAFPYQAHIMTIYGGQGWKRARTLEEAIDKAEKEKPPKSYDGVTLPIQHRWVTDTRGNVLWERDEMSDAEARQLREEVERQEAEARRRKKPGRRRIARHSPTAYDNVHQDSPLRGGVVRDRFERRRSAVSKWGLQGRKQGVGISLWVSKHIYKWRREWEQEKDELDSRFVRRIDQLVEVLVDEESDVGMLRKALTQARKLFDEAYYDVAYGRLRGLRGSPHTGLSRRQDERISQHGKRDSSFN